MKLVKTVDTRTLIFNGQSFLNLVVYTAKNKKRYSGKYSITLEPWIEYEKPCLLTKMTAYNEYEIVVYNVISENYGDTNKDNHILRTRTSFIYTNEDGNSKKELFEQLLIQTDEYNSSHFFSFVTNAKNKLFGIELITSITLEDFEFFLVKLGTKYRPFPEIDHQDFFSVWPKGI